LEGLRGVILEVDQQEEELLGRAFQKGVAVFAEGGVLARAAWKGVVAVVLLPERLEIAQYSNSTTVRLVSDRNLLSCFF
jgi:hypothetical protein